jgi:two-component system response regulator FlrC
LTDDALGRLRNYPFAGNVRELENLIHRAVLLADGETIGAESLWFEEGEMPLPAVVPESEKSHDFKGTPLREVERIVIFDTLEQTGGNRTHAAKILGISVRTLRNKLNEYRADGSEIP